MNVTLEAQPAVIVVGGRSQFAQHITAGVHEIVADESLAAGGQDAGPSLDFQACSFNYSDISPLLESTSYERLRTDSRTRRGRCGR